jgi:hypothetical protein
MSGYRRRLPLFGLLNGAWGLLKVSPTKTGSATTSVADTCTFSLGNAIVDERNGQLLLYAKCCTVAADLADRAVLATLFR